MNRLLLTLTLGLMGLYAYGQPEERGKSLPDYIEAAQRNSPLIKNYRNQMEMQQTELGRLKALYTHSRLELNGEYLFVPIVSKDGGRTSFLWNAQDGTNYYGYDLGESSGHLHAGATWTQPILGNSSYKVAREQVQASTEQASNYIRMEKHQLERAVTEQYLLCLLDQTQMDFADSIGTVLDQQTQIVRKLVTNGLARQTDLRLLAIEKEANDELYTAAAQSYQSHLSDLNVLCGICDSTLVKLQPTHLELRLQPAGKESLFAEQYRLDSLNAEVALRSFNLQYKPRFDLFVNGGLQTGNFAGWYKHFGWGAGLTFSWTLFDSKQKRFKEQQTRLQQSTIRTYQAHTELQRLNSIRQCLSELEKYDEREKSLNKQRAEYESLLSDYRKEMAAGQVSILDYITVLRNKIQTEKDYLLLRTNRQLVVATYNYWNW